MTTAATDEVRDLGKAAEWLVCLTPTGKPPSRPTVKKWRTDGVRIGRKVVRLVAVPVGVAGVGIRKQDAERFIREIAEARGGTV